MARTATTADIFNAVAEPRRRTLLDAIGAAELPVTALVTATGMSQPQVSKHLRVLREVDAVLVRQEGRSRLYRANGAALKPIHDWAAGYADLWSERLGDLDVVLAEMTNEERHDDERT